MHPHTSPTPSARVAIIGQGYVGLPLAHAAVTAGYDVVGYDLDAAKINRISHGSSPIGDITDLDLAAMFGTGRYTPTTDADALDGFDIAVITVPTPLRDRVPDLTHVEAAARELAQRARPGTLIVLESTTWPGTTTDVVAPAIAAAGHTVGGGGVLLGYSPERVDPGNPHWRLENTPKVIAGIDDASFDAVAGFYSAFINTLVPAGGCAEAEMAKLMENTQRTVAISLANELSTVAHALGIDIWDVCDLAATKPFGYLPIYPGPGVGGHCLPVDPLYLSWRAEQRIGEPSQLVRIADSVNRSMPAVVVRRVQAGLNDRGLATNGARILVVGLAYKPNTNDARETPAVDVVRGFCDLGADVSVYDPLVTDFDLADHVKQIHPGELSSDLVAGYDAVVVLTIHDGTDASVFAAADYVFDTRRALPAAIATETL